MPEAWYDPSETKAQANGAQTQPEFAPPAQESTTEEVDPEGHIAQIVSITNTLAADVEAKLAHTY